MAQFYYDEEDYYDDEYYEGGFQKIKKKNNKKKKGKGHQNKYGQKKNDFFEDSFWNPETLNKEIVSKPKKVIETKPVDPVFVPKPQTFTPGEHSQEIRGFTIDFDRLADIQTIEQEHNGDITYGIKFLFAGKKGLYRIAWYNKNKKLRDIVFEEKVNYWNSLK